LIFTVVFIKVFSRSRKPALHDQTKRFAEVSGHYKVMVDLW